MLWALFGNQCKYLTKLHEICTCLDSDQVTECWANFTPSFCRQIMWAIIDCGREYFSQTMLPDRLLVPPGGYIQFPHSSLEELIISATFPSQWSLTRAGAPPIATTTGVQASVTTTTTAPVAAVFAATHANNNTTTNSSTNSTFTQAMTTAPSTTSSLTGASQQTQQRVIQQSNVHPTIKTLLEPFIL